MVFSISPSVTFSEIDLTSAVPSVATSPAAIVGVFNWGPVNERILVTSESDLANRFGSPSNYNAETFFTAADFLAYSNALYVTRVVSTSNASPAATATSTNFSALYPGDLGNALKVSYVVDPGAYSNTVFTGTQLNPSVFGITFNSNTFHMSANSDLFSTFTVNDILRVGNSTIGYQNLVISNIVNTSANGVYSTSMTFTNNYTLYELDYSQLNYQRIWGYANYVNGAPSQGSMHIIVEDATGAISGKAGTVLEVYQNVSQSPTATLPDGSNNYYGTVITNKSSWITYNQTGGTGTLNAAASSFGYETLSGGLNGASESAIGFGDLAKGYDLYKDTSAIDISFILGGKSVTDATMANYITSNILETRKDVMLFLSPRSTDVVGISSPQQQLENIISFRNLVQNSSYWFMDSGYKYRYDKYNDLYRYTPLNGDIAGLAAVIQPWQSPAGYKRGLIKNAIKLAFNPDKSQRDQLYSSDINPVMAQAGQGILLFGDKTGLGQDSAFNRINVRRLFIVVEKNISAASSSFLFDINDTFTQTQFKNMVEPFLRDIQGNRGITDFLVVCDSTVNTPAVVDAEIFKANIFIQPARSINFIQLAFVATKTGVSFNEIVGLVQ